MRKILNLLYHLINKYYFYRYNVLIKDDYRINGILFVRNYGFVNIGNKFKASSGKRMNPIGGDTICRIYCRRGAKVSIGNNVGISNSTLHIFNKLTIKDNVLVGGGCKIWDSDFHSLNYTIRNSDSDFDINSKEIIIEDNVFIGASSIVLKGVTIGENSIIGAGSVVTKNVPPNEIWAGNPANFVRKIDLESL